MEKINIRKMALTGVLMALVILSIFFVKIPIPSGLGYIHIADSFILLSALLGPGYAFAAGGVGGMLADILAGYGTYAPWTLAVHGLQGLLMAILLPRMKKADARMFFILGLAISAATVVPGYYLAEVLMYGSWSTPLLGLPLNLIQVAAGSALGALLYVPSLKIFRNGQGK